MGMMRPLQSVIQELSDDEGELTIFVEPTSEVTASTAAQLLSQETDEVDHLQYLLEVDLALEACLALEEQLGYTPSLEQKVEAVLHYAANDAFLDPTASKP